MSRSPGALRSRSIRAYQRRTLGARAILEDLLKRRADEYIAGTLLVHVSLGVGEYEQAISWLEKAAEERDGLLPYINLGFWYDPLRSDPRFQALLSRMNFPFHASCQLAGAAALRAENRQA